VLPSIEEGFGRVLVEASACGLPVIASDIPGIDEAVRHEESGLLVKARSRQAWIEALPLLPATYAFTVSIFDDACTHPFDYCDRAFSFEVVGGGTTEQGGSVALPVKWKYDIR
ncbi:MAG: glycosyltransferase, partial [Nitrospinota bacterium]